MSYLVRILAVFGFLGVALGAIGSHMVKPTLVALGTVEIWQTAILYHLFHVAAGLWATSRSKWVVGLWIAGMVLFSGALYGYALTELAWLRKVTPVGGMLFLAGWLLLLLRREKTTQV